MAKIKVSIEEEELLKSKEKNYTFSFQRFKKISNISDKIVFNNNFRSVVHFIKTNSDLFAAMELLSRENYNSTIVQKKLEKVMHFKELTEDDSIKRIREILTNVFSENEELVKQLENGRYIEFGMTDECRFVAILIDYSIINMLYLDPNHLTFPNYNFDVPIKMSYTTPCIYNSKSDKILNYKTSSLPYDFNENDFLKINSLSEKEREKLEFIEDMFSELVSGKLECNDFIELAKEIVAKKESEIIE